VFPHIFKIDTLATPFHLQQRSPVLIYPLPNSEPSTIHGFVDIQGGLPGRSYTMKPWLPWAAFWQLEVSMSSLLDGSDVDD
jgi:hypothetical protein